MSHKSEGCTKASSLTLGAVLPSVRAMSLPVPRGRTATGTLERPRSNSVRTTAVTVPSPPAQTTRGCEPAERRTSRRRTASNRPSRLRAYASGGNGTFWHELRTWTPRPPPLRTFTSITMGTADASARSAASDGISLNCASVATALGFLTQRRRFRYKTRASSTNNTTRLEAAIRRDAFEAMGCRVRTVKPPGSASFTSAIGRHGNFATPRSTDWLVFRGVFGGTHWPLNTY